MEPDTEVDSIEAVDRSIQIVETLRELEGAGVTEIAEELGWAKSTAFTHLRTLEKNEYLVRDGDEYDLSLRFLDFGEYVKDRRAVYSSIEPRLDELASRTGKRVQFITNEHGYGVYVRIAEGNHSVNTGSTLGRRRTVLHATAAGKSILAYLPESEVERILDRRGLPRLTQNTITDRAELYDELAAIRDRGYAINHEEHIQGLRAIAAPVRTPADEVVGSISIADAAHRMKGESFEEELPELLLGVANEVELEIAYS